LSVVVVGLEHESAPLALLERCAVGDAAVPKLLGALVANANVEECVIVSTCLRTEVYAVVDRFHDAVEQVHELLAHSAGVDLAELEAHATVRFDDAVARHLFEVAAGLRSAVPGESEVLGQVRRAWERAVAEGASGPVLADLFRHAVHTGKRVRSETAIARGTTSFSHAAIELAEATLVGGLGGRRAVVLGAGELGRGLVAGLAALAPDSAPSEIVVLNRSVRGAQDLVARTSGDAPVVAGSLEEIAERVGTADVVFGAVDTDQHLVGPSDVAGRAGTPLLVVDLAVPRSVDPAVGDVAGVTLLGMEALRASVEGAMAERQSEAVHAFALVEEELDRYRSATRERGAAPVIAALRLRLEAERVQELDRRRPQFAGLSEEQWEQVDLATRSVLAKILHEPTVVLKDTAGTSRGERLVEALRLLFDL
jgi:glutamyl-tRNA reductase